LGICVQKCFTDKGAQSKQFGDHCCSVCVIAFLFGVTVNCRYKKSTTHRKQVSWERRAPKSLVHRKISCN